MWLLILLFGGFLFLWYFEDKKRCIGMPPGPPRIPFVGNLLQVAYQSHIPSLALMKLAKTYGDVMHVRLGIVDFVILSSHEAATEFLHSEHGATKASFKYIESRNLGKNYAIIFSNGQVWQNLRRFTLRTLRDFGFGKSSSMDVVINDELDKFLVHFEKHIDSARDNVIFLNDQFELSIVSILWRLVSGKNYEMGDKKMMTLLRLSTAYCKSGNVADLTVAYPWISDWFPMLTSFGLQRRYISDMKAFLKELIEEHREEGTYLNNPLCLIDEYLRKIEEGKDEEFTYEQLLYVVLDLFQAGSETTSKSICWGLLYLTVYPKVQEKAQREIDSVIGANEPIIFAMRERLPFTHAVVLETMRLGNVLALLSPRQCLKDMKFRGFTIKKDSPVMINGQAIHLQESNWGKDADIFRPERFIGEDGLLRTKLVEKMIQFGGGKRQCLGQNLAETNSFVFIASIIRKFKLETVGDEKPSILPKLGLTIGPNPFHLRIRRRNK